MICAQTMSQSTQLGFSQTISKDSLFISEINDMWMIYSFPVAQLVEHGASNAKIMGSIPRESKSW